MQITMSPNVRRAVTADPMYAIAYETMHRDARDGYLNLYAEGPTFFAVYTPRGGETSRSSSGDLITAIIDVVELAEAAA